MTVTTIHQPYHTIQAIALDVIQPHPLNANVMPVVLFNKLVKHLSGGQAYPPLIVRPLTETSIHSEPTASSPDPGDAVVGYQLLDGHHRCRALRELGETHAQCLVWPCDDARALELLATLNRLQGDDDPIRRGELLVRLAELQPLQELADRLPETLEKLRQKIKLVDPVPIVPRPAIPEADQRVAVHFFLLPAERRRVLHRLKSLAERREEALMRLIDAPAD